MQPPQFTNLGRERIQEFADNIAIYHKIQGHGKPDLNRLLLNIGGSVDETGSKYALVIRKKSDFTIHLEKTTSRAEDRYFVAQQLGHFFLHYRSFNLNEAQRKPFKFLRHGMNPALVEEASEFARALLLPADYLQAVKPDDTDFIQELTAALDVPAEVVQARLHDLIS